METPTRAQRARSHAPDIQRKNSCQQRESKRVPGTVGEGAEKEEKLTAASRVCSGKSKEDMTARISPATGDEEEDAAISGRCRFDSFMAYGEDSMLNILEASVYEQVTTGAGRRQPWHGGLRSCTE
jgi:hypothetical protein